MAPVHWKRGREKELRLGSVAHCVAPAMIHHHHDALVTLLSCRSWLDTDPVWLIHGHVHQSVSAQLGPLCVCTAHTASIANIYWFGLAGVRTNIA